MVFTQKHEVYNIITRLTNILQDWLTNSFSIFHWSNKKVTQLSHNCRTKTSTTFLSITRHFNIFTSFSFIARLSLQSPFFLFQHLWLLYQLSIQCYAWVEHVTFSSTFKKLNDLKIINISLDLHFFTNWVTYWFLVKYSLEHSSKRTCSESISPS